MANDWILMLPELLLLLGALVVAFIGFYVKGRGVRPALTLTFLLASMAATVWLAFGTAPQYIDGFADHRHTIFDVFEVTQFALFFKVVFLLVAILVALVSSDYLRGDRETTEYYTLLLVSTLGMMVVASARDLITLFVGLETSTLATYALVAFRKTQPRVVESGTKYFVISSLSTSLTLYGISLVYAVGGTVNLYSLAALLANAPGHATLLLACGFLLAGLGFKVSTVPFHMWAPDVYEGSPDTISAFLAAGSKKMGFAALIKIFLVALVAIRLQWDLLVGILAVLTMTIGNLGALQQTSLKRLLAWSSIAQAGYILIALPVGTTYALSGALLHILVHAVMKGGAFVLVATLAVRGVGEKIDDWKGVGRRFPLVGFAMSLIMLSMAGLPPLAGFVSKFILFSSAVQAGLPAGPRHWLIWLAVAGILNSALSLYYYARVIRALYVEDLEGASAAPVPIARLTTGAVVVCAIVIVTLILFGVYPQPAVDFATKAASSLLP
jgi:NADH-quinone oxidoreductase subunit N